MRKHKKTIKPFIKWAGGKSQILGEIQEQYPQNFGNKINKYCEPFIGGGAVLFDILSKYDLYSVLINDINKELINTYIQIRDNVHELISMLKEYEDEYLPSNKESRKNIFYENRNRFNSLKTSGGLSSDIEKAALFIFLNRTCFNGLYRENSKGLFNVPIGSYKNPKICDKENLVNVSFALKNVEIICGDYKNCIEFIDENTFVYIDPPYRPLNKTASFTAYSSNGFGDKEQIELGEFVKSIHSRGAKTLISNSDPKNTDKHDNFFDELYNDFNIRRIDAKRMINCDGSSRGEIKELLICNW